MINFIKVRLLTTYVFKVNSDFHVNHHYGCKALCHIFSDMTC